MLKTSLPFIVIALCVGMFYMYISPKWDEVNALKAKKGEYDNVLNEVKELKAQRDAASTAYNSISQDDLDKLNKMIPENLDTVSFANNISAMATQNSLLVENFDNKDNFTTDADKAAASAGQNYISHNLVFKVKGSFTNFIKFLKTLESGEQLTDISKITIDALTGKNDADQTLEYTLGVNTYSLK